MDLQEIFRYIEIGVGYVEVDRSYPERYGGLCRRIYIRENEIQIDFCTSCDVETDEGEETFYFRYDDTEEAVKAAEKFIGKPSGEWKNFNCTSDEWNFSPENEEAMRNFQIDLYNHNLRFPKGFRSFTARTHYARGLIMRAISPEADTEWTAELFETIEEAGDFTEY